MVENVESKITFYYPGGVYITLYELPDPISTSYERL